MAALQKGVQVDGGLTGDIMAAEVAIAIMRDVRSGEFEGKAKELLAAAVSSMLKHYGVKED